MAIDPEDVRSDENARALRGARAQRLLLVGGGAAYLALTIAVVSPAGFAAVGTLAAVAAAVLCLAGVRPQHARFPALILPLTAALVFSSGIVAGAIFSPEPDVVRFSLLCGLLAPFLSLLSPTRRGALASLVAMSAIVALGALFIAARAASFDATTAIMYLLASVALALAISRTLENARAEAVILRGELERRATSDEITGVSNRAHVSLLAQNEFSRARRYGEPFSCLTIELDRYQRLLDDHGRSAVTAIVQVFTGYCVVVMRHCDSFGRLTPARFLALLPETPVTGAHTLAKRMCRDLADLAVSYGGGKLHFTVSIGVTEMHAVDRSAGDLLRRCGQGLADALERGGNCATVAHVPASLPLDLELQSAADAPPP